MGQVFVVRHGQASFGSADYDELSEMGRQQGALLGEFWAEHGPPFDAVFTGPAKRHQQTEAEVAAKVRERGQPWPECELLPELDEHDGFALVAQAVPQLLRDPAFRPIAAGLATAKGPARAAAFQRVFEAAMLRFIDDDLELGAVEAFAPFRDRVLAGLEKIFAASRDGRRVVAFSSVGPVAVILSHVLALPPARAFETAWRLRNAGITSFVHGRGRSTLDRFNALPHLRDPQLHTFR